MESGERYLCTITNPIHAPTRNTDNIRNTKEAIFISMLVAAGSIILALSIGNGWE